MRRFDRGPARPLLASGLALAHCPAARALTGAVDYTGGVDALASAVEAVAIWMTDAVYIVYAVATVVSIVAALRIYVKMNAGEQGVWKDVLTLFFGVLFIVGMTTVLPAFFGWMVETPSRWAVVHGAPGFMP